MHQFVRNLTQRGALKPWQFQDRHQRLSIGIGETLSDDSARARALVSNLRKIASIAASTPPVILLLM